MCGILGAWSFGGKVEPSDFRRRLGRLAHRGPDGEGIEFLDAGALAFGHRRLSIIDLTEAGRQPMANEDGSVVVTFNGEIYNFRTLRSTLVGLGHHFRSESDTEVVVHAYEEWGDGCVSRFRGIFAFAVWDSRRRRIFAARDQLGVKPLYYSFNRDGFRFASEPQAITEDALGAVSICREALRDFFAFSYVPSPKCIFEGIYKLGAGSSLAVEDGRLTLHKYFNVTYRPQIKRVEEAAEAVGATLEEVARLQFESDVPIGSLLSGGIDSSLLTGLLADRNADRGTRAKSYTIGFDDERCDERPFARLAAEHLGTEHCERLFGADGFRRQLARSIATFSEPFDPNGPMPALLLAGLVSGDSTKVVWGGDGGDELFSGYLRYDRFREYLSRRRWLGPLGRSFGPLREMAADRYFSFEGFAGAEEMAAIFGPDQPREFLRGYRDAYQVHYDAGLPAITSAKLVDMNLYLVDHILCKVDRAMMAYGVECRVPLLDHEMVELAFSIDDSAHHRGGERKAVLKRVAAEHLLENLLGARKKGFSSPVGTWSDRAFRKWAVSVVEDGFLVGSGFVRPGAASGFGKRGSGAFRLLWLLLTAELWAQTWICGNPLPILGAEPEAA